MLQSSQCYRLASVAVQLISVVIDAYLPKDYRKGANPTSKVLVLAVEDAVTSFRARAMRSIVDLNFLKPLHARNLKQRVSEYYTHSDHQ